MNIIIYTSCLCLVYATSAKEDISNFAHEDRKFRSVKYNDIWKRALKTVPKKDLPELGRMLKKLDKSEIDLKHYSGEEGYDEDAAKHLQNHLTYILHRFGVMEDINTTHFAKITFADPRLNRMWIQAVKEGNYSPDELESLHDELKHMEGKLNDYHSFSGTVESHEKRLNEELENDAHGNNNFVDHTDEESDNKKLKKMKKQLKHDYHHLQESVQMLEQTVQDRIGRAGDTFSDARVLNLWKKAEDTGKFSDKELQSIKEELQHFQTRIDKLRHWEGMSQKLEKSVKDEGLDHIREEYDNAKKRVEEHKKYVKKYHATMLNRVYQHSEL